MQAAAYAQNLVVTGFLAIATIPAEDHSQNMLEADDLEFGHIPLGEDC